MKLPRLFVWLFSAGIMVLGTGVASCQTYPNKTIRIVTTPAGGGVDVALRQIAQELTSSLGSTVIVDNQPAGILSGQTVAKAPPDGYTLLFTGNNLWIGSLIQKTPYNVATDFSPISLTNTQAQVLVVHPSLPVASVKELIALAKARPGELNYGTGPAGSMPHLAAELFKAMARVNIVRIPYKSAAPAANALIAGEVQVEFASSGTVAAHIKSGGLRGLAVCSLQPSALAPGLPTIAASGLPGYEAGSMQGLFAPAKTPRMVINRLNQEIVRILSRADVKEKFLNIGFDAVSSSPEEFEAAIKADVGKFGKLINDVGIRAE